MKRIGFIGLGLPEFDDLYVAAHIPERAGAKIDPTRPH
jgi:hypothetical protein